MTRHQPTKLKRYDPLGHQILAGSAFIPTTGYAVDCSCSWRGPMYSGHAGAAVSFVHHVRDAAAEEAIMAVAAATEIDPTVIRDLA